MKIILLAAKLVPDPGPSEEAEGAAGGGGGDGGGNDLNKLRDAVPLYPDLEAALGAMEPMPGSSSSSWTTEEEVEDVDTLTLPPTTPSSPSKNGNDGEGEDDKNKKKVEEEGAGKDDEADDEEKKKKEEKSKKKTTATAPAYDYSFYGGGSSYSSGSSSRSSGGSYWFFMYCLLLCTWSVGRHHQSFEVGQNTRLECGFGGWSCDDVCQNMDENMLGCCLTLTKNGTVPANMTFTTGNVSGTATTTTTKAPPPGPPAPTSSIILKTLKKVTTPSTPKPPPTSKSGEDKKQFCHCCRVEGIQRLYRKGLSSGPILNRDKIKMPKMCGGCKLVEISNIRLQLHVSPEELERRRRYKALMA